jgi:hypothetical protein
MRPANILRPIKLTTTLPEDVWLRLTAYLHSDLEGRVPVGAYQKFIIERINEFFARRENRAEP